MRIRFAMLALVSLAGSACVQRFDATSLGVPATMASPTAQPAQGEAFRLKQTAIYMVAGLLPLSQPKLDKALAAQLVGGKGVANLKITVKSSWLDVLVTGVTLGLIVPRSVIFEGTIVGEATPASP